MIDGRTLSSGSISTSDGAVVIRLRNGNQSFATDQIKKVSVRKGGKRWCDASVGAAIGAGSMGTLAAIVAGGEGPSFVSAAASGYAGIGALFPGYDALYRTPKK